MSSLVAHECPFPLDGSVTREKRTELLSVQTELKWLDYKSECNLNSKPSLVELVKDCGAMQVAGGYLVVGVDDSGAVVGLPPGQARLLDESVVRSKMDKYLGLGYDIRSAVHHVDAGSGALEVAIVWVAPHPDGCNVFAENGDYTDAQGRQRTAFRNGDIYARHGTKSEPWNQSDRAEANTNTERRAKERWRAEMSDEFSQLVYAATTANTITSTSSLAYTWQLDAVGFEAASIELMRRDDDIPSRHASDSGG